VSFAQITCSIACRFKMASPEEDYPLFGFFLTEKNIKFSPA